MKNPWTNLPSRGRLVLSEDRPFIQQFNERLIDGPRDERWIRDDWVPEPFFGNPKAPVVVLLANPGVDREGSDDALHARRDFRSALRASLDHTSSTSHFWLQPRWSRTPGGRWWLSATRELSEDVGTESVASGLFCVEFFPYHSSKFGQAHLRLPSQQYTFHLIREAIDRDATIVCARGESYWLGAVPELAGRRTETIFKVNSKSRSAAVSRANLGKGYDRVATRLRVARHT